MDSIISYLPYPSQRGLPPSVQQMVHRIQSSRPSGESVGASISTATAARHSGLGPVLLVFKVCFNPHLGPLSLVRVYSGTVSAGTVVTNWSQRGSIQATEKVRQMVICFFLFLSPQTISSQNRFKEFFKN